MTVHGFGMAEVLLGFDGFRVLEVTEGTAELAVREETTGEVVECPGADGGPTIRTGSTHQRSTR
jgi:hypothetical protein